MKYLLYVLIVCWLPVAVKGQSVSEKMKRYQDDSSYKCGKACAFSYEEADRAALENLVSQISVSVSASPRVNHRLTAETKPITNATLTAGCVPSLLELYPT